MGQVLSLNEYRKRRRPADAIEVTLALYTAWLQLVFWWVPERSR